MKYIISETQSDKLKEYIEYLINSALDNIRDESDDWGLGEMDEIDEITSIDKIVVDRIVQNKWTNVYVNIVREPMSYRDEYENTINDIQFRIEEWIPNIELFINDII
jgi:hypothetical protein